MWDERGLLEHSLRKKERQQIISKIEVKHYLEMRKNRSEGSEVASDYTTQLRHAVRRSKSEKLTFLHRQHLRKRLITQLAQPNAYQSSPFHLHSLPLPHQNEANISLAKQPEDSHGKRAEEEASKINIEVQFSSSSEQQSNSEQLQHQKAYKKEKFIIQGQPSQEKNQKFQSKKHFLPMLQLYIQELNSIKSMTAHEKKIRNIIVTMMVLAINRRHNGRNFDALDILLQTQIYFPRQSKEMLNLKSVWLALIGKIYQEINHSFKTSSGSNRWKRTTRKSALKSTLQVKRQKTIFIRSLASKKAFFDRFSECLRKSKLIYESTYLMELKNELNIMKIEGGRRTISKVNSQLMISYPEPQILYPENEEIVNYAIIMVNKDKQASLFPLNYPQALVGFINKQDYMSKIIKINSYLIPTARCMNSHSALFINFELILSILILLFAAAFLLTFSSSSITSIAVIATSFLLLLLASAKMHAQSQRSIQQVGQADQFMEKCCSQWEEEYRQLQIKFILSMHCDVLIICFPIDEDASEEEQHSSFAFENQINSSPKDKVEKADNRKCSIRLPTSWFENPLDQVNEDSSDNEPETEFWKQIAAKVSNCGSEELRQQFDASFSQQSQDQVIGSALPTANPIDVEMEAADGGLPLDIQ